MSAVGSRQVRRAPVRAPAPAQRKPAARRRSQRESQAVLVAFLSVLATAVALYDLMLFAVNV
ncbi:MAG TPA: hypothetical protein VFB42_09335 [Gaiellaceae bacterium]|nr:hypothetical protein [Gaiellaceae bacterium]